MITKCVFIYKGVFFAENSHVHSQVFKVDLYPSYTKRKRIIIWPCVDETKTNKNHHWLTRCATDFIFNYTGANCNNILTPACVHKCYIVWSSVVEEMLNIPCRNHE